MSANLNLAQALVKAGRPGEAAARYELILRDDPSNIKALYNLGTLHGMAGRYTRARALLKQTVWKEIGTPYFAYYDPPWIVGPLRRNEVLIPVSKPAP